MRGSRRIFCAWESAHRRHHDALRHAYHAPGCRHHQRRRRGLLYARPDVYGQPAGLRRGSESLAILESGAWQTQVAAIEAQLKQQLSAAAEAEYVADVRVLGAIGVIETTHPVNMAALQRFFVARACGCDLSVS